MAKSRPAPSYTAMSYDSFKPKFPLDPFAPSDNVPVVRPPWTLDASTLPPLPFLETERRTILVIGQPTPSALEPLLQSPQLTSSLLILASHRPPALPSEVRPAVHTLRLRNPIAVEDAGAARLVDILEWATQVARLWRQTGGPRVQELLEEVSGSSDSVKLGQTFGRVRYSVVPGSTASVPATPASSANNLSTSAYLATHASSSKRRFSMRSFRSRTETSIPVVLSESDQRPLDAIFHFIPANVPDKAMLKSAILVTSLSRPYLSIAPSRAPATRFWSDGSKPVANPTNGRRLSFFRSSGSATSSSTIINADPKPEQLPLNSRSSTKLFDELSQPGAAALLRCRKPRLIHVMPSLPAKAGQLPTLTAAAQAHLIRSIEAFLLSFSFSLPGSPRTDPDLARARPYILPAEALKDVVQLHTADSSDDSNDWTLAELILSGALERDDPTPEGMKPVAVQDVKGKQKEAEAAGLLSAAGALDWAGRRAWIGGLSDISMGSKLKPKLGANTSALQTTARGSDLRTTQQSFPNTAKADKLPAPATIEKSLPSPLREIAETQSSPQQLPRPERPPRSPQRISVAQKPFDKPIRPGAGTSVSTGFVPKPSGLRNHSYRPDSPADRHAYDDATETGKPLTHRSGISPSEAHGLPTPPDSEEASLENDVITPQSSRPSTSLSAPMFSTPTPRRSRERRVDVNHDHRERDREREHDRERRVEHQRRRARTEPDPSARAALKVNDHPKKPRGQSQPSISLISLPLADAAAARVRADKPSSSLVSLPMMNAAPRVLPRSKTIAVVPSSSSAAKPGISPELEHAERKRSLRRETRRHMSPREADVSRTPSPSSSPNRDRERERERVRTQPTSAAPTAPKGERTRSKSETAPTTYVQIGRAAHGSEDAFALVPTGTALDASAKGPVGARDRDREHGRQHELRHKSSKWKFWQNAA